jgi:putative protease
MESYSLKKGDNILITGPTTGVIESKVEEIHTTDGPVEQVEKGDTFSIKINSPVRKSDKLYKLLSE